MASWSSWVKRWGWIHLVALAALIIQPTTPRAIFGRWSTTSAVIIVAFLLSTPFVWFGAHWLANRLISLVLTSAQSLGIMILSGLIVFVLWAVNTGPTDSYLIVRLYMTCVVCTIAIWSLHALPIPQWMNRLVPALCIGSCGLLLVTASSFPGLLWTDEGYIASVAVGLIQTGHPRALLLNPLNVESFSLTYFGMAYWFKQFGIGLISGRIYIFVLGLISLALLYFAVRQLYSSFTAWAIVILGAFALIFDNYLRTDIEVTVCLAAAFLFWVVAQRRNRVWLHVLVGLSLGFSLDGHPSAYRFCIGFGLAYLLEYALVLRNRRRLVIYWPVIYLIIGGVLGVGLYFGLYATLAAANFGTYVRAPFLHPDALTILQTLFAHFDSALHVAPLLLGLSALGIFVAARRRNVQDRLVLVVIVTSVVIMSFFYGIYHIYYFLHLLVPLSILAAGQLSAVEKALAEKTASSHLVDSLAARLGIIILLLVACLGWLWQGIHSEASQDYKQALNVADLIRPLVSKDQRFIGIDPFYLRMTDYPLFSEINIASLYANQRNVDEATAWEQIAPSAVAIVRGYPAAPPAGLLDYIGTHNFTLIRCWQTNRLGRVDLYVQTASQPVVAIDHCDSLVD